MPKVKIIIAVFALVGACLTGPTARANLQGVTLFVNSTGDAKDALPGDGVCAITIGGSLCTLRAAIEETNALIGQDTIILPAGIYPIALQGQSGYSPFDIAGDVMIRGAGPTLTLVSGNDLTGVFTVQKVKKVQITHMTISDGVMYRDGGGISNQGDLTLEHVRLSHNRALGESIFVAPGRGGAIYNGQSAVLTLRNSSVFSNTAVQSNWNSAPAAGGGIYNEGKAVIVNSTIADNLSQGSGGGLYVIGETTIRNSTIYGNAALTRDNVPAGGDNLVGLQYQLANTIVAGSGPSSCSGTVASLGGNLDSGESCGLSATTDITKTDPMLVPVKTTFDVVASFEPMPGSPVIDRGVDATCEGNDQRGVGRPRDGDGDGVARCDIGSIEMLRLRTFMPLSAR